MKSSRWTPARLALSAIVVVLVIVGLFAAAWSLRSVDYLASGKQQMALTIECGFDKFRQIMVRKDATHAIITQGGMKLIEEKLEAIQLDTSRDKRPLLNALRGESKSELGAVKEITVSLDDPALAADRLVLRQQADIQAESIQVDTRSVAPAGNLESYETTLRAHPQGESTQVELTVAMQVRVTVPRLFTSRADGKVQQAADRALDEQAHALQIFVSDSANKRFILPDLKP